MPALDIEIGRFDAPALRQFVHAGHHARLTPAETPLRGFSSVEPKGSGCGYRGGPFLFYETGVS
jgi:hypothetical protein